MSLLVKEGWRDRETGKTGDPRINFLSFQQLQDTLAKNAEKLTLQLDINDFDDRLLYKDGNKINLDLLIKQFPFK